MPHRLDPLLPLANKKRSVCIGHLKTSISLEDVFWEHFLTIAKDLGMTKQALLQEISQDKSDNISLSGAVRVFAMKDALKTIERLKAANHTVAA
jgi:predicted DNA-binding ribbon-helix-helix protein